MGYDKERNRAEVEALDREIEKGHRYVELVFALGLPILSRQKLEIQSEMAALLRGSRYLSEILDRHPDPVSFLANRSQSRNLAEHDHEDRGCDLSRRGWSEGEETLRDSFGAMQFGFELQEDLREHRQEKLYAMA